MPHAQKMGLIARDVTNLIYIWDSHQYVCQTALIDIIQLMASVFLVYCLVWLAAQQLHVYLVRHYSFMEVSVYKHKVLEFINSDCPTPTFPSLQNFTCSLCNPNGSASGCLTCNSVTNCTSCLTNFLLFNSTCLPSNFFNYLSLPISVFC